MLRKLVFMLLVVSLALTASSGFCTVWRYWGNMAPNTPGLCPGTATADLLATWSAYDTYGTLLNMGSVDLDPAASDGKAWRIVDTDAAVSDVWRTPGVLSNPDGLDSALGATILARIKTTSETDGGGNIGICHQSYGAFAHWGGANGDLREVIRPNQDVILPSPPADGNYHTIRLTAKGEFQGTVPPISYDFNNPTYVNGVIRDQDHWSGDTTGVVTILDGKLVVAAATANPSGATPALRSCPMNPDANGKITFSMTFYAQATPCDWVFQIKMLDSNSKEMAGWQGGANHIRARIGGVATGAVTLAEGPHVCKIVYDVATNIGTYYIDNVLHGTLNCDLLPEEGNRLGFISVTHKGDDARSAGRSASFDDFLIEGAEVPNTSRTINMYVDNVLKKSITYAATANIPGGRTDNFVFGSGAGMQDVSFDWIVMTNEGAFAPADDVKHFGYSLDPGDHAVTSFADIATAPIGSQVDLKGAITTVAFLGTVPSTGYTGSIGFAIEDPDRFAGIRVLSDNQELGLYQASKVDVEGTLGLVDGERVVMANNVTNTQTTAENPIKPIAISNKSVAGGAKGVQPGMVDFADKNSGTPAYTESFTYDNGPLAGNGGWADDSTDRLAVVNGALKISAGGWDFPLDTMKVTKAVNAGDCGTGKITMKMKLKAGSGIDNFWYMHVRDSAGTEIFYLMGAGTTITGRGQASYTTGFKTLKTDGTQDNLEVRIVGGTTVQFYLNNTSIGSCAATFNGSIGSIQFERLANVVPITDNVSVDDIQILPSAGTGSGLNSVGILSKIFGRVSHVKGTGAWDDYFYVDDGTGYIDGTSDGTAKNIGIRCRPNPSQEMPTAGEYVVVTGVMGAKAAGGNTIRFFWTDSFESQIEE